jgi:hypothetical protein
MNNNRKSFINNDLRVKINAAQIHLARRLTGDSRTNCFSGIAYGPDNR